MIKAKPATLLITFNRPDYTERVIERLREIEVSRLYVFNDGPRMNNEMDETARKQIHALVDSIDWGCEVHKYYSDANLGCGLGVSSAISWAFKSEDRLIILEDDCIPSSAFYPYCEELLEKYKDDQRVWVICGENHDFPPSAFEMGDYVFSQYGFNWGWATWRRCWEKFDLSMPHLNYLLSTEYKYSLFSGKAMCRSYYNKLKSIRIETKRPSFWTVQFGYQILLSRGYFVIPAKNLITNIGADGDHTSFASRFINCSSYDSFSIKRHPSFVLHINSVDNYHYKHHIKRLFGTKPIIHRIKDRIMKALKA